MIDEVKDDHKIRESYEAGFDQAVSSLKTIVDSVIDNEEQKSMIFELMRYIKYK